MRRIVGLTGLLVLASALGALGGDRGRKATGDEGPDWIPLDDPKVLALAAKIEAAGTYRGAGSRA